MSSQLPFNARTSNEPETYSLMPVPEGGNSHSLQSPETHTIYHHTPTSDGSFHPPPPSPYGPLTDPLTLYGSPEVRSANPQATGPGGIYHAPYEYPRRLAESFVPDTQSNDVLAFLIPLIIPTSSYMDTGLSEFDVDSNVLGDFDGLTGNQMTRFTQSEVHHDTAQFSNSILRQQLSLPPAGPMGHQMHGYPGTAPSSSDAADASDGQEYTFNPASALDFSILSSSADHPEETALLEMGTAPPHALPVFDLRDVDPTDGSVLPRASLRSYRTWPETTADESLHRALLRSQSLRGYPAGVPLELELYESGASSSIPDTPTLTESSSAFMSPSPNPGSSQDEGPDPRRAVVGSAANVNAARSRRKRPAKFRCEQCGRMFTARHNLTNHENSHNGIRPFPCKKACGQTFTTAGTAARHTRTCKASVRSTTVPDVSA